MKGKQFYILLCFLFLIQQIVAQIPSTIDSVKNKLSLLNTTEQKTNAYFTIADEYMNIEQYDSAQIWLNKIHDILPVKTNSLSNYFLLTRQAEVYYYNNLQQLGLQESRKGLAMAQALNDSLLLADSYNFLGLFYMNIDSSKTSLPYYKRGLQYCRQPPYPSQYLSLSKPHHLHGNFAEAFQNLKMYDSALYYYKFSLANAQQINWDRGIAVAYYGLGEAFFNLQKNDSALISYKAGIEVANKSNDIDVALVCYGGVAKALHNQKNIADCNKNLALGFAFLQKQPNINRYFALQFLTTAIKIYKEENNTTELIKTLELKSIIETKNVTSNNTQIQTILNAGVANEKKVLSLQLEDAKQKQNLANTRLLLALGGIAFLLIGFLVYRYYQNQKLAVSKIRQKISQDLHDDIGASLSSLQIYSTVANQSIENNPTKAIEMVNKISYQSKQLMENMNDIVWSMKTNTDSTTSLQTKIKNYAAELLQDKNIELAVIINDNAETYLQNINARKNILLIIKEILNNAAKYSEATVMNLSIEIENNFWKLAISDNGKGFIQTETNFGNGLKNISNRTKELDGTYTLQSNNGTSYVFLFPLAELSKS